MKRLLFLICFFSLSVEASSFEPFYQGLKSAFYLEDIKRGVEVSNHVALKKVSPLGRILSPDAVATYNDKINIISLDESLLRKVGNKYIALDASLILTPNYSSYYKVATIFHELGHAEMDVFIENEKELADLTLKYFYKTKLKPLYRRYFKGMNPWTVFHEHFAYYRTDLIETLSLDIMDLMLENGWIANSQRCFLTAPLKKQLEDGVSVGEFLAIQTNKERKYNSIGPSYIFVRGRDLELSKISASDQLVIKQAHQLFWEYHQEFYGFPKSLGELVKAVDKDKRYEKLKECRLKIYDQL